MSRRGAPPPPFRTGTKLSCSCREPKRSADCFYCGSGFEPWLCGFCHEAGIDGKLIRGTSRRRCRLHLAKPPAAFWLEQGGLRSESHEPVCRRCELPGDRCGCEPHGDFAP